MLSVIIQTEKEILPGITCIWNFIKVQFSSVQLLSHVRLFVTPGIAACQASLSITNSRSSLRLTAIESMMPSNHLILCCPLLLLPPIPPSIRVFSSESTLCMRWPLGNLISLHFNFIFCNVGIMTPIFHGDLFRF